MMRAAKRSVWVAGLLAAVGLTGCSGVSPFEYISGGTGAVTTLSDHASVTVLTPPGNLSIQGGTQVEVNWQAIAKSRFSTLDVIVDADETPDNGNESIAFSGLVLTETTVLVDTTRLLQGTYHIGVVMREVGQIVAFGYAPGAVTIDQRPQLFFTDAKTQGALTVRGNYFFDRTQRIDPTFEVNWQLVDPDSINTVELLLDPDDAPNGNEVSLYKSAPQPQGTSTGTFTFDLPTATFAAGTYRILAAVSDGQNSTYFYAPGTIHLRARRAGYVDLRDIHLPESGLNGAVFEGFNPRDNAGSFLSQVGDLDRDGFNDFIILSQFGKTRYQFNAERLGIGEAYLIYGRRERFSGAINLNSTGTLFRGEVFEGPPEVPDPVRPSRGITSFTILSDWDGDGLHEMAFGLPFTDSASIGGFVLGPQGLNIAPLDPNGYFRTGAVVVVASSALRPDLGFPGRNVFNLAEFGTLAHLPLAAPQCPEGFYGPKAPFSPQGSENTYFHEHLVGVTGAPNSGSIRLGCRFSSSDFGDQFGETITGWDFDALVMAAPNRDPFVSILGAQHVPGGGVISAFYVDVKDGFYPWTNGQAPPANAAFNYPGSAQSAGNRLLPHGGPYHYIIDDLGGNPGYTVDPEDAPPCVRVIDAHMATPERTVRFWSNQPGARVSNVKGIGDVNGDGLLDLVIGAPLANGGSGACYIVLGRVRELLMGGELQLEELALPMNAPSGNRQRIFDGIQIVGSPGEQLGQAQDSAGDFNGDGYPDVVIGSPLLNGRRGGVVVFFGSRDVINLTQGEIPFNEIPSRGLGVIFEGEQDGDLAGARVAGVGDLDGDGNDDILIAAPNRSVRLDLNGDGKVEIDRINCGVVYLVYGSPDLKNKRSQRADGSFTEPGRLLLSDIGTENVPGAVFIGRNSGDFLGAGLGEQGDRSFGIAGVGDVDGDGARDILLGSASAAPRNHEHAGEVYLLYGARD